MTIGNTMTTKVLAGVVGLAMAVTFSFAGAIAANAQSDSQTLEELQAQIQALQQQLAQLQGGSGSGTVMGCATNFTQNLSTGDRGNQVMQLQKFLNHRAQGVQVAAGNAPGSPGNETSYFGPATKAAVTQFQNMNATQVLQPVGLSQGTGYWGPSSRSHANNVCMQVRQARQDDDGDGDDGTDGTDGDDNKLEGGAGSINSADWVSKINNEEVGEGEDDRKVAGLEVEADEGSDIEIRAVQLDFSDENSDNNSPDLDDYAEDVSIWLDGEKLAEVDADKFEDDNNYTKTVSLDMGAIIRAGEEENLEVAVSGLSNIDSNDAGDDWNVAFPTVRFKDAQGAVISDSSTGNIGNDSSSERRVFNFETFATASSAELRVKISNNTPSAQVIDVDNNNDTDDIEMLRFELKAKGDSDLRVRDLPVTFATSGAKTEDIINNAELTVNGNDYSESVSNSAVANGTTTFSDFDETIPAGDTWEAVLMVDVNNVGTGNFTEGDELDASVSAANMNATRVDDESGQSLTNSDKTGTASGEIFAFYDNGIQLNLVSTDTDKVQEDGADNDTATMQIKYDVTTFGSNIFVSDSPSATTTQSTNIDFQPSSDGVYYRVDQNGAATTTGLGDTLTVNNKSKAWINTGATNGVEITEDNTGKFTLTVDRTNSSTNDDGQYRTGLEAVTWNTSDASHNSVYTFDLEDYETDYVFVN